MKEYMTGRLVYVCVRVYVWHGRVMDMRTV